MGRPIKNFGDYLVGWNGNVITFVPKYRDASVTKPFGLGNATIVLNKSNLPTDGLTVPITGETTGEGILPNSPFALKRWFSYPNTVIMVGTTLTGVNGWTKNFTYPQATSNSVKEVSATQIAQHGYASKRLDVTGRVEW